MNCSEKEFHAACSELLLFGTTNHERISFDSRTNQIKTFAKACWLSRVITYIKRLFCCQAHPAERVAERLLGFFESHEKMIAFEHFEALSKLHGIKNVSSQTTTRITALFQRCNSRKKNLAHEVTDTAIQEMEKYYKLVRTKYPSEEEQKKKNNDLANKYVEVFPLHWNGLLDKPHTMDTVLTCSDGDVKAHLAVLSTLPYFQKISSSESIGPKAIDFKRFSAQTVQAFLKILYNKGTLKEADTPIEILIDLFEIYSFCGKENALITYHIDFKISKNPLLCFETLLKIPKRHPALPFFLGNICLHCQWNDWSEISQEKKDKMIAWIEELEKPEFEDYVQKEKSIIPFLAQYYMGKFGKVNQPEKAFKILQEQVKEKDIHVRTKVYLGVCHLQGIGTPKNEEEALRIFREVNTDHPLAGYWLFHFHFFKNMNLPRDLTVYPIIRICSEGYRAPFNYDSAKKCEESTHVDSADAKIVIKYYETAIQCGHLQALRGLGNYYLKSNNKETRKLGIQKLEELGNRGNIEIQHEMGVLYTTGITFPKNRNLGRMWLEKAANQGNEKSKKYLKENYGVTYDN